MMADSSFDSFLNGQPHFPLSNMQHGHGHAQGHGHGNYDALANTNNRTPIGNLDTVNLINTNLTNTTRVGSGTTTLSRHSQSAPTIPHRQSTGGSTSTSAPLLPPQTAITASVYHHQHQGMGPPAGSDFNDLLTDFWADQENMGSPTRSSSTGAVETAHTDRLLSFRAHSPPGITLLNSANQIVDIDLQAQLHGMFFLAESPWDAAGNTPDVGVVQQPKELTCYRRNLFQVSGSVSLPNISSVLVGGTGENGEGVDGKQRQIQALEASISGIESVEGNQVKIIMVPWKSTASQANQQAEDPPVAASSRSAEKEPAPIFLNYSPNYFGNTPGSYQDEDFEPSNFQLNWKRLQFRAATANNGRRKDLQQHFLVRISIIATLYPEAGGPQAGEKLTLFETYSGAIIVRGRSPRNFSSRNDIPLSGSVASTSRQAPATSTPSASQAAHKKIRHHSSNSLTDFGSSPALQQLQESSPFGMALASSTADYMSNPLDASMVMGANAVGGMAYNPNLWATADTANTNWMFGTGAINQPMQSMPPRLKQEDSGNTDYLGSGTYYATTSMFDPANTNPSPRLNLNGAGALPIEDYSASVSPPIPPPQALHQQAQHPHRAHVKSNSTSSVSGMAPPPPHPQQRPGPMPRVTSISSPSTADLQLYEYFPIGVDDWLPPVEVVYRPHAAHHTTAVVNKGNGRSKRLFSEVPFE